MTLSDAVVIEPEPVGDDPAADQAASRELLERVARGEQASGLRIWRPVRGLALTRLDELRPGAERARELARTAGFTATTRVSGGHAVLLGSGSFCVGFAERAASFEGTQLRYRRLVAALVGSFMGFGVEAEQGDLPGEWCPGTWSIRSGQVKLAGLAQRAIRGAAWAEAVVELSPNPETRALYPQVYDALELDFEPSTLGSLSELAGRTVEFDELAEPLVAALSS